MSADPYAAHGHHEIEMPHASMRDYAIGFVLSVILTAIPFWLVMERPLGAAACQLSAVPEQLRHDIVGQCRGGALRAGVSGERGGGVRAGVEYRNLYQRNGIRPR